MTSARLMRGLLFVVVLLFATALAAPTEAQTMKGCEVSPPRPDGKTVWELAGAGLVTGPLPALGEFAARTLGFSGRALEMAKARNYVRKLNRELEACFFGSDSEDPVLAPLLWDNPPAFQNRILGAVMALEILPPTDKDELQTIKTLRAKLMPTPLETPGQIRKFILENPSGTRFIVSIKGDVDALHDIIDAAPEGTLSRRVQFEHRVGNVSIYEVR